MCNISSKKLPKSSHLEIQEQTFPSVHYGYLMVQIQISINQNQDLSSRFEECVSSLFWRAKMH